MTDLAAALVEHGIRIRSREPGSYKLTCPQCSHARRNKADPCLSVTVNGDEHAVWNCHHCGWTGSAPSPRTNGTAFKPRQRKAVPAKPKYDAGNLPSHVIEWFAGRGISEATLKRNGVGYGRMWLPAKRAEVNAVMFPYRRNGEVVNIKFRDGEKNFSQVKGAEKIFYGLDDIACCEDVIIVEAVEDFLGTLDLGMEADAGSSVPQEA